MRRLLVIVLLGWAGPPGEGNSGKPRAPWHTEFAAAQAEARASNKPIFAVIY